MCLTAVSVTHMIWKNAWSCYGHRHQCIICVQVVFDAFSCNTKQTLFSYKHRHRFYADKNLQMMVKVMNCKRCRSQTWIDINAHLVTSSHTRPGVAVGLSVWKKNAVLFKNKKQPNNNKNYKNILFFQVKTRLTKNATTIHFYKALLNIATTIHKQGVWTRWYWQQDEEKRVTS